MSADRQALEAALVENPDDLAAHAAYADLLVEEGDPRGEFIQVQLALEDEKRSPAERKRLQKREAELLKQHEGEWLGKLAPFRKRTWGSSPQWQYRFARGWLDQVVCGYLDMDLAQATAQEPATRLLRRLVIDTIDDPLNDPDYDPNSQEKSDPVDALLESPYLANVRCFHLCTADGFLENQSEPLYYSARWELYFLGGNTCTLIEKMRRLEELYLSVNLVSGERLFGSDKLTNLRVLQVYLAEEYPLKELARNKALAKLTHLSLHPRALDRGDNERRPFLRLPQVRELLKPGRLPALTHLRLHQTDIGDKGCQEIVQSGILKRLKFLDLALGCITDEGARALADCPDLKNLEVLDLSRNALTPAGITLLGRKVATFRADDQHDEDDHGHLYEGQME